MPAATLRRISMKALARYQVILLGEQRHIRCEQLAQGCCPNSAAVGVEPATSRSRVQRSNHYTTEPPISIWPSGVFDRRSDGLELATWRAQRSGRVVLTVLSSFLRQSCLVFTNVTNAIEVFLNVMRYIINPRFTYLLTYLSAWKQLASKG